MCYELIKQAVCVFLAQRYIKKVEGVKAEDRRLSNAPKTYL